MEFGDLVFKCMFSQALLARTIEKRYNDEVDELGVRAIGNGA